MRAKYFLLTMVFVMALSSSYSYGLQSEITDCERAREVYKKGAQALNYEVRRDAFQKAVDLCPSFAEAHVNLADALENIALIRPNFDQKNLDVGSALLDKAVNEYHEALRLNDRLTVARWGLIDIYMVRGSYGLAVQEYRKILSIEPYNEQARDGLGRVTRFLSDEKTGLRKSNEIVNDTKVSLKQMGLKTMGFQDRTIRDRQSFNNILFGGWSASISAGEATEQLNEIGKALTSSEMSTYQFIIEGHTNNVGDELSNVKLSWDRAQSVKSYLVKNFGIDSSRLLIQGFGYHRPKFPNDTEENRIRNRRVEIVFVNNEHMR